MPNQDRDEVVRWDSRRVWRALQLFFVESNDLFGSRVTEYLLVEAGHLASYFGCGLQLQRCKQSVLGREVRPVQAR